MASTLKYSIMLMAQQPQCVHKVIVMVITLSVKSLQLYHAKVRSPDHNRPVP